MRASGDWGPSAAIHLDDHGVALAAARADRRAAEAAAAAAQLEHQRAEDPRAGGADRVAERDRAAVDVDPVLVDPEHPDRVQRDRGERLVDLPQVDVLGASGRPSRAPSWRPWPASAPGRRSRRRPAAWATIVASARLAVALGPLVAGEHQRAGAVVDAGRVAGGVRAVLRRRSAGSLASVSSEVSRRGRLVDLDHGVALPGPDRDRHDLLGQAALVGGLDRELVRAQRPAVHVGAGQLELGRRPRWPPGPCACPRTGWSGRR